MATHLSVRLAWHMDGWNGCICRKPSSNHYCVGLHSYPGDMIRKNRDLDWESKKAVAGVSCAKLDQSPPCIYSINAFGPEELVAYADPPVFFNSGKRTTWKLPPATICTWPYEQMYCEEAETDGRKDYKKRLELAKEYFQAIEPNKSLVFHYANYSNPFSEEEAKRYVVVGLSRVKKLGQIQFYQGTDEETREKFGGGFIWQMNVETHYPDQGLRIPYHRYLDNPDVLERIALFPDNPRCFKFGTRYLSDDDALSLVERFIEIATFLRDSKDKSEDWAIRLKWLNSLLGELWHSRGLYPGLARVLELLGLSVANQALRQAVAVGKEKEYHDAVFRWLDQKRGASLPGVRLSSADESRVRRQWQLRTDAERRLLREVLPRFDLPKDQMERILSEERTKNCIYASLEEIGDNPYLLTEQYVGDDPDDVIPFSRIDHGVFPSPELGGKCLYDVDNWRRLRALCVGSLNAESKHTFVGTGSLLQGINKRLAMLPEWKRTQFNERYLEVDREELEQALVFRGQDKRDYVYLRSVYDAEREIERRIRELAARPDIKLRSPVTEKHWREFLFDAKSPLARKARSDYDAAIADQAKVCDAVLRKPVSVVCGTAGTGKTTVISALLRAIDKAHRDASFLLLAPTGKAADRIREKTGKDASTIHSFLARLGWLNPNLTIKPSGGQCEDDVTTYVIDEASMLNLELMAALFRAINWESVQRLIIVGDHNQLPPIGRGRVFADIIEWLKESHPDNLGELTVNLRQMLNKSMNKGTGIIELASLYVRPPAGDAKDEGACLRAEEVFQRLQDLPKDGCFDKDLRVLFWKDADDLLKKLTDQMVADMEQDTGEKLDPDAVYKLWSAAAKCGGRSERPDYHQVISPYLHEDFGTEAINEHLQRMIRGKMMETKGLIDGITLFDKVIQVRNRTVSDPIYAWDYNQKECVRVDVFNGELGFVQPHNWDSSRWRSREFRLERFQVKFARKEHLAVGYGRKLGPFVHKGRKRWIPEQKPEENLELAYAISVHKSQGSEFDRVYFVLPKTKAALLSPELFYTGITRATRHCTLLIEQDIAPLLKIYRPEASYLLGINSSLFEFTPVPDDFDRLRRPGFLEEGKIHQTLANFMVRSKSEVIIANILFDRKIPFEYEKPLYARDGSFYLPDFTIHRHGETFYWEHLGLLEDKEYRRKWELKKAWYNKHFPGRLITTEESGDLSRQVERIVRDLLS